MTIAIRRPIAVLAACAAVGALVTGCGAGPGGEIGAAAVVGGSTVSLDTVQADITSVLADNAAARQLQQQKPSTFPPIARTVVQLAVWDEVTKQLAAKLGVKVNEEQVDRAYTQQTASGQLPSFSDTANIPVKGDLLKGYLRDSLLWNAIGAKQVRTTSVTFDYAVTQDRNGAQALVDKVVANPGQHAQIFTAAMAGAQSQDGSAPKSTVNQTGSPATTPQELGPMFAANAGSVLAFPVQQENIWVVAYVIKRSDNAGDTTGGQDVSQIAAGFGQSQMVRYAQQVGVTLNPRFGVWEPLTGFVSPSAGESSSIMKTVRAANQ
ncbi:SurA N-terminal domain-containing protein [Kutzneria sp. CA-103260]|uniref:SurA N-terminal domain-containing protein n=1 Tax=Kutzneria sp. CA-103260 TaxID=2802641 RepID=UPI001BACDBDE|nr:SurA N-terminal domain-containing protein [Kutzneria sp. CA-103260]QUQ69211.1 hypothetical protein JJ691_69660 [Kutzneria sp. CA-103260]